MTVAASRETSAQEVASREPASEATTEPTGSEASEGAEVPGGNPTAPIRSIRASRRSGPVEIDGSLAERSWQAAPVASGFWQREPHEGAPPGQETAFRVLYDDDALYVGVHAYDTDPEAIRGVMTRRDGESFSDWLLVSVDSYYDRRTAFTFGLNPTDVQLDLLIYDDVIEDPSWDAVWDGATHVSDEGWSAEFRIPLSQLRFANAVEQTWGIQVIRIIQRTSEISFWTPAPRSRPEMVSRFGDLVGVRITGPSRRLEILPYASAGTRLRPAELERGLDDTLEPIYNTGLDFTYGVSSDFTVTGTLNPDFGQVEVDPSEVNLTDSETFFAEKRPFFLEGIDIFRATLGQDDGGGVVDDDADEELFYSRRIGGVPYRSGVGGYDGGGADFTTIYGAAKLSGKTSGGWSLGALSALTAEEAVEVAQEDGSAAQEVIEPLTSYSVFRLEKDLNGGRTTIGLSATNVVRRLEGTGLADDLHRSAHAGGVQVTYRSPGGFWNLDTRLFGSAVTGEEAAIAATQESSQRYYQRPDAAHLDYAPDRTSLTGAAFQGSLKLLVDKSVSGAVGVDARSPGFEVNDLGFQRRADYLLNWLWAEYRDEVPGRYARDMGLRLKVFGLSDWAPDLLTLGGHAVGWANLVNFWSFEARVGAEQQRLDTELLRGGPAVVGLPSYRAALELSSDSRRRVQGSAGGGAWYRPGNDSWLAEGFAELVIQPRSNIEVRMGPFVSKNVDDSQFVETVTDAEQGLHYVLGRLDQTTLGLEARLNYTFSPHLSLQVYVQPFISSGSFSEYKQPREPRAGAYEERFETFGPEALTEEGTASGPVVGVDQSGDGVPDFTFGRPDFTVRDLRSTAILRWEYRPGSTLFAIWNHNHSGADSDGALRLGSNLSALRYSRGEHVLLFKLNYWWDV